MSFLKNMFSTGKLITVHIKRNNSTTILKAKPGENLMDLTNKLVNSNSNIYGLCDKQLACTTCSVNVKTHYDLLPEATDEEVDVLFQLKNYRDGETRMACQIVIQPELENIVIEIPNIL